MFALYIHRTSIIHRMPAGAKLLATLVIGSVIFLCEPLWLILSILAGLIGLYWIAELPFESLIASIKPLFLAIALIFALQFFISGFAEAMTVIVRIVSAVLIASLVTLTTRMADMLDVLMRISRPLAFFGVNPTRFALAVSLAIRFIPTLLNDLGEMRQAKLARRAQGLRVFAVGPLIIKILRMTGTVGNAIAARGFENRK